MFTISDRKINQRKDFVLNITNNSNEKKMEIDSSQPSFEKGTLTFGVNSSHNNTNKNVNLYSEAGMTTDNLYPHFRTFLIFGKCIGLISFEGLFQSKDQVSFKKQCITVLPKIIIWILLASASMVNLVHVCRGEHFSNAADYAFALAECFFLGLGLFVNIFYMKSSPALISIFQQWNRMKLNNTKLDTGLARYVNILAGIMLTSAILENITGHLRSIPALSPPRHDEGGMGAIEIYYRRELVAWADLLPYHPALAVCFFFVNKVAVYSWNFMDITLAIFARAIYFKFKMLFLIGRSQLCGNGTGAQHSTDVHKWRQLTEDFEKLVEILRQISDLLSPLIFVSFAANVYFVILYVHHGMMPGNSQSVVAAIYSKWAFIHLIARLCMVSLVSAQINVWAHKCSELFTKCPTQAYVAEVQRTDHFLSSVTLGFNGLKFFTVTRSLVLQIVSVVFTFEIVLLQASKASSSC